MTKEQSLTLVKVLRSGRQADPDGVEVRISRQAVEEAANMIEAMASVGIRQETKLTQLHGNLSLAEEGLANYALEVERLKAALRLLDNGFKYSTEVCNIARGALAQSSHEPNQDGRQTPAPSGHVGLGTAGGASSLHQPTHEPLEHPPCPFPALDGTSVDGKHLGPNVWGIGTVSWHPETQDWRCLADVQGCLCSVVVRVTAQPQTEQPVATSGAIHPTEDSVRQTAESSGPRGLLASEAASFNKTLARSPRIISPGASRSEPSPQRPSPPPATARLCGDCKRMKDDSGETFGWGLCHCGSFRQPVQGASRDASSPHAEADQCANYPDCSICGPEKSA